MQNNKDKYYIVRTARAGVFFGKIADRTSEEVSMTDVRKLWFWSGAAAVEQIAKNGVTKPDRCRFTIFVDEMIVSEPIQIIPCSDMAIECIKAVKPWKI